MSRIATAAGAALCLLGLGWAAQARATNLCTTFPDPENHTWSAEWIDGLGQTRYSLTAPCKAFMTIPFTVTVQASDPGFPGTWVGGLWSLTDTPSGGTATELAGGTFIFLDGAGQWSQVVSITYPYGSAVDHQIEFSFTDFGEGSGAHSWAGSVVGDVVVDPPPTGVPAPPSAALLATGLLLAGGLRRR